MSNSAVTDSGPENMENVADGAVRPSTEHAPVKTQNRIESLDFIRGLAVMGILWANIVSFGQPFSAYMYPDAWIGPDGDPGGWMWVAQFVLIDGKMRGLFTLLFGAGMYLFMERAWARGETRQLQAWRLVLLMGFGLIHFFLIWIGDILFYYAVCGLVVLLFLGMKPQNQLILGGIAFFFGALFYFLVLGMLGFVADAAPDGQAFLEQAQAGLMEGKLQALNQDQVVAGLKQSGDYFGWIAHRVTNDWLTILGNAVFFSFELVPLMLIGVALYRLGLFSGGIPERSLKIWGWSGLLIGGVLHLLLALYVQSNGFTYYGTLAAFIGHSPIPRLFMAVGMLALLAVYSPSWNGWLAERVRAAGRMAFSNYLGTSIVMLFLFHGWAFGLFGELTRPQLYLVVVVTCAVMVAWSKPWLERFRYGPLEWLWRCLTYRKLLPLAR